MIIILMKIMMLKAILIRITVILLTIWGPITTFLATPASAEKSGARSCKVNLLFANTFVGVELRCSYFRTRKICKSFYQHMPTQGDEISKSAIEILKKFD